MALSRRMAAPFLIIVIVVAAETAAARDVVDEKLCQSQSSTFKGICDDNAFCDDTCKDEKYIGGACGFPFKCMCKKVC